MLFNWTIAYKPWNSILFSLKLFEKNLTTHNSSSLDRPFLKSGSGFQSLQFRLIENKVGVTSENRIKRIVGAEEKDYKTFFEPDEITELEKSEKDRKTLFKTAEVQSTTYD